MTWRRYDLIFRLQSPLHIGYRRIGNLMQTRGYAPGRNLWAALTERLTRDFVQRPAARDYIAIGGQVKTFFRFTYLYPATAIQEPAGKPLAAPDMRVHHPWDDVHFDYLFLDSYASTALDYDRRAAADGTLHEVTFLRPYTRARAGQPSQPVYLAGSVYVQEAWPEGSPLRHWRHALDRLQVGGERTYGWGRMKRMSALQEGVEQPPELTLAAGEPLPAHALAVSHQQRRPIRSARGPIEPMVGWERDNDASTRRWRLTPDPAICYAPGSRVRRAQTCQIGPLGLLFT